MLGANYLTSTYLGQDYFNRTFAETLTRSLSDSLGLTDNVANDYYPGILRALSEAMGLTDNTVGATTFSRLLSETEGLTDSVDRVISFLRSLSESEGITDSISKTSTMPRVIEDSLGITDALARMIRAGNISISPTVIKIMKPSGLIVSFKPSASLFKNLAIISDLSIK